jgi:hypothetical protein
VQRDGGAPPRPQAIGRWWAGLERRPSPKEDEEAAGESDSETMVIGDDQTLTAAWRGHTLGQPRLGRPIALRGLKL